MTKVQCADSSCKYWNGNDKCTAKNVVLNWTSVMTIHSGRQEFLICKTREPDEMYLEAMEKLIRFMEGRNDE